MMKMVIGAVLFIFAVLILNLIQLLIRQHCYKAKKQKDKQLSEFQARREEVERKSRRQL